ncbi:MAG: endonuclease domain-containing protein [Chloroflexota bacterium]|nr:endonuclease domain-containing protein [Chloroflexota bacterium]
MISEHKRHPLVCGVVFTYIAMAISNTRKEHGHSLGTSIMPKQNKFRASQHTALVIQARQHRSGLTVSEALLWQQLRARCLNGHKFRRQHPIDRFIVDFCCLEHKLIVEIDGRIHQTQAERDAERTAALEGLGFRVLRFTNDQVEHDMVSVLNALRQALVPE